MEAPGFGFSRAGSNFDYSVSAYARVFGEALVALGISDPILAFPCVWGYPALLLSARDGRVRAVVTSQAPAWDEEQRWAQRIDFRGMIATPFVGQLLMHIAASRVAGIWYRNALPRDASLHPWHGPATDAFRHGGAFALASLGQAWFQSPAPALQTSKPVIALWGAQDRTHRHSDPMSLRTHAPECTVERLEQCSHFPDLQTAELWSNRIESIVQD